MTRGGSFKPLESCHPTSTSSFETKARDLRLSIMSEKASQTQADSQTLADSADVSENRPPRDVDIEGPDKYICIHSYMIQISIHMQTPTSAHTHDADM